MYEAHLEGSKLNIDKVLLSLAMNLDSPFNQLDVKKLFFLG